MNAQNPADMKVADLKTEIDARNEGRVDDDKIPADGNRDDLIAALQLDDERAARVAELQGPSAPATDTPAPTAEPAKVVPKSVKLVHPEHKTEVEVIKPSKDYTNYVRGYGYQEAK